MGVPYETSCGKHFFYVKERNVKKIELNISLVMSIAHPRAASSRSERMLDAGGN